MRYLWLWYQELAATRQFSDGIAHAICHREIRAWAENTGRVPNPWEVSVIRRMDDASLAARYEEVGPDRRDNVEFAVTDTVAVKAVMSNLKARAARVFGNSQQQ